jgi:hypothetical protein
MLSNEKNNTYSELMLTEQEKINKQNKKRKIVMDKVKEMI